MAGRIFVTGGSGFVGSAVIDELLAHNYAVSALSRSKSLSAGRDVATVPGDLFDSAALEAGMRGCEAVIHLVGIIMESPSRGSTFERIHFEGTRRIVDAAKRAGVRRYVQMSALGARDGARSRYHQTKFAAEQYVRASGLEYTIFRPSLIHGPRGEFMKMEAMWARYRAPAPIFFMPFMPYFGAGPLGRGGAGRLQPILVNEVARAFVESLQNPKTIGETYLLGGAERLSWPYLHETVAVAVVKHRRLVVPIPVWVAKIYAAVGIGRLLGFNRDQVIMSQEENTCDLTKFEETFGWKPLPMGEALATYAAQL